MHTHSDETTHTTSVHWRTDEVLEQGAGNLGVYHAREEFDLWWFVGIVFIKLHDEFKRPIFKRCISRSNNNRIPTQKKPSQH